MLKHRLRLFVAVLGLFLGASIPAAAAGAEYASIPFDFVVQGVAFPAGTYRVSATSSPRVVIVSNEANLKQSFITLLPIGESLVNGDARLALQRKSFGSRKAVLHGDQK